MTRAVACLLLAAGCDVAITEHGQPIIGGELDTRDESVVAIVSRRTQCNQTSFDVECTGTVIGAQVVLTAAHCLAPGAVGTLEVYVGPRVGEPTGRFILVDDAVRHPQFDDATHAYDLGLVHLAERAPAPPVDLPAAQLDDSYVGARARVVGYGVTATGTIADGQRRQTTMQVSAVAALTFTAAPDPGNSCGGDSGGPVFVATPTGEQLLGVTSAGDPLCMARAVDARVDAAASDFILTYLVAPPVIAAPAIELADTCTATCATTADCPASLACQAGHCVLAGTLPASYHATCASDAECGAGTCARVTPDECRCAVACGPGGPGGPGGGGDNSCNASGRSSWLVLLAIGVTMRRSRRRTRA